MLFARLHIVLAVFCMLFFGAGSVEASEPIRLVYLSRLAEIQVPKDKGAFAELASLLKNLREESPNVLFVHGGSALGPSTLASFDKGAHMVGLLNRLEPALMAVGRRDFTHKEDELILRAQEADFPLVASNIMDSHSGKNLEGLAQSYIHTIAGRKIGFISLVSPGLMTSYVPERVQVTGAYELLPGLVQSLREDRADFVIVLADFEPENPQSIMQQSGADMLLISDGENNQAQLIHNKLYATQRLENEVLRVDFVLEDVPGQPGRVQALFLENPSFVPLSSFKPDADFTKYIADYLNVLDTLLGEKVVFITSPLDTTTMILRTRENAFANILADALRDYYRADIALINAGALRGNRQYEAQTYLTHKDLHIEMPLHDSSVLIQIRGKDLLLALEHGLSRIEDVKGSFLQVSGMTFIFHPDKPAGSRLVKDSVQIGGKPLDPEALYSLATVDFLANGGDGFVMLKQAGSLPQKQALEVSEMVRAYLAAKKTISPVVEGRIRTSP